MAVLVQYSGLELQVTALTLNFELRSSHDIPSAADSSATREQGVQQIKAVKHASLHQAAEALQLAEAALAHSGKSQHNSLDCQYTVSRI